MTNQLDNDITGHHPVRTAQDLPDLLTVQELSEYLCIPLSTLYEWNSKDQGPVPLKLGKHLRYPKQNVLDWLPTLARH